MPAHKINCWEFKHCERGPCGDKIREMGVCPAATDAGYDKINGGINSGRVCWAIAGTFCDNKVQGSFAQKEISCMACEFFAKVKEEEGRDNFILKKPEE